MPETAEKRTTVERQSAFLSAYCETADVKESAARAGISATCHYNWKKSDAKYRDAWELTISHLVDSLVAAGYQRAIQGVPKVMTHRGEMIMVPTINKFTGAIELDGEGKSVMMPLIEWNIDYRAWEKLLSAWDPSMFNRSSMPTKDLGPTGQVKGKRIIIEDKRQYPRITRNGRA